MVFAGSSRVLSIAAHVGIPSLFFILNSCSTLSVVMSLMFTINVCCIVFSPWAFFGMLRSSEYTSPTISNYFPESTLQLTDISFSLNQQFAIIVIKQSKTDPFKAGCTIRVAATNSVICPVTALRQYLHVRVPVVVGPLFLFQNRCFLTRQFVSDFLHRALPNINCNTHSFRIGGASAAASAGVSDAVIKILGRWSSDAYRRYIRLSDTIVQDAGLRISNLDVATKFWDTDTGTSHPL